MAVRRFDPARDRVPLQSFLAGERVVPIASNLHAGYDDYQRLARDRRILVIVLEPYLAGHA